MTVTRSMVADYVEAAFDSPPVERAGLLKAAINAHAPDKVIDILNSLPDRHYTSLRHLWPDLSHLPIE